MKTLEEALEALATLTARLIELERRAGHLERLARHMGGGHRSIPALLCAYNLPADEADPSEET